MATLIPIKELTEEKSKQIQDMLAIVPIDKEEEKMKKWGNMAKSKIPKKQGEIIPMFKIDFIDETPYIRVPFRFGCAFQNKLVNRDSEYPKVVFDFKAKLRPHQIPVAEEAYKQLYMTGTTTLGLCTGFGKTLISLYLGGLTKSIIAVNITIQALTDSWISTFLKCYPDLKERIWVVGEHEMPKDPVFILFMYTRYEKIPLELRRKIGCLIIDEAHLHCTIGKTDALLSITPKYVIALTATMERTDGLENMMYSIVGKHNIERLSENPFTMIRLKTGIKIEEERGMFGVNYAKFVNDQAECLERNLQIINIVNGNRHRKFMILTKTKEHVENLEKLFLHYGILCATYFGNKKSHFDEKVLIGTLGKLSTGYDGATASKEFDGVNANTLILTATIKKEALMKQTIGRIVGRAENPVVVYMIDSNASQSRHYNETKDMIEKVKGGIVTIEYDEKIAGGGVILP